MENNIEDRLTRLENLAKVQQDFNTKLKEGMIDCTTFVTRFLIQLDNLRIFNMINAVFIAVLAVWNFLKS